MINKQIFVLYFMILLSFTSCESSVFKPTSIQKTENHVISISDTIPLKGKSIPKFKSKLHEPWVKHRNEREINHEFCPDIEELKKGKMVFQWKHTISAQDLKKIKAEEVHIINFSRDDRDIFEEFLANADSFTNLEAIRIGGINLEGELINKLILKLSNKKYFRKLLLSVSYLKTLPNSIKKLNQIETLDLSNNELTTLPPEIGQLSKLKHLNLRNNRNLKILPTEIGNLIHLEYLGFEGSKLSKIPNSIGNCTKLKKIVGNACKIESIPSEITMCVELLDINLAYNKIENVPSEIGNLVKLKTLSLGRNKISSIPNSFKNLDNLKFCGLEHNQFLTFPNPILGLTKVQNLWLHENAFKNVPIEIANLKTLTYFLVDEPELNTREVKQIKELNPQIRFIDED